LNGTFTTTLPVDSNTASISFLVFCSTATPTSLFHCRGIYSSASSSFVGKGVKDY
jgi:hypothetical protein